MHEKALELIPWYVNGSLPADERRSVEEHVRECLPCRAALREEERLSGLISRQDDVPLSPEHGFSDLLTRIDSRRVTPGRFPLRPGFAFAAGLVAVAIASAVLLPRFFVVETASDRAPFSTLSDVAESSGARIDIVFAAGIEPTEIEAILRTVRGRIVDGPTEVGRYTVAVPAADTDALDALIENLSTHPKVRFAGRNFIESRDRGAGEP
jgi:hypothetical protein